MASMRGGRVSLLVMSGAILACGQRPLPVPAPVPSPTSTPPLVRIDVDASTSTLTAEETVSGATDILGYRSYSLVVGLAAEVDFEMKQGAAVTAEFRASAPLVLDAHHHPSADEVVIYGTGYGRAGRLQFTAPFDGVFSFLWAPAGAPGAPVDVYLLLRGDAKVVRWIVGAPTSPTGEPDASLPGPALDL